MSALDDLEAVVRLAILTSDRTPAEQKACLRLAMQVEKGRNILDVTNKRPRTEPANRLVSEVLSAGWDEEADKPLPGLKPEVLAKIDLRRARWETTDDSTLWAK